MKKLILFIVISLMSNITKAQWYPIGPAPQNGNQANKVSGRILSIAFSPQYQLNGTTSLPFMLIGIDGGGIWRSYDYQNAAPTWTPLTDNLAGAQHIYSIVISPNDPKTIFAGAENGNLLQSSDGGSTWTKIVTGAATDYTGDIVKVIIDPVSNTLYFATHYTGLPLGGIYKQTSSGFSQINVGLPSVVTIICDMDFSIGTDNKITIYAANQINADASNPDNFGIWYYTEQNGNWTNMNNQINYYDIKTSAVTDKTSLGGITRLAADHAPGAPLGIYAAVGNGKSLTLMNVFKLSGTEWQPIGSNIMGSVISTYACLDFGLSPSGALYVGLGNVQQQSIFQSTNFGGSWASILAGTGNPAITPHVDQRSFGFNSGKVYLGNDGGLYRFNPLSSGKAGRSKWESLNSNSLQTILVQGASINPGDQGSALCASQDNSITLLKNGVWIDAKTGVGDGGNIMFDPDPDNDGKYAYANSVSSFSFIFRSTDAGQKWTDISPPDAKAQKAVAGNYPPFTIDPQNTSHIAVGIDRIYESIDRGNAWGGAKSPVFSSGCTAIAYAGDNIIWAAYGTMLIETVNDGGDGTASNWPDKSEGINFGGAIVKIAIDPRNIQHVYLATDSGMVWKRTIVRADTSWSNITSNLPKLIINTLALIPTGGSAPPMLYAGTNIGVYTSSDDGATWQTNNTNLPLGNVLDLQCTGNPGIMVAGLYGRGIFKLYLPPLTDVAPALAGVKKNVYFFEKSPDGRIFYDQAVLGQAGLGWRQMNGNMLTDAAPAAGVVGGHIYVVVKGLDGGLYLNQADLGGSFGQWFPMNFQTNEPAAVVGVGKDVYFFAISVDGRVFSNHAAVGHAGSGWVEVTGAGRTDAAPSAGAIGNHVYVAIKGLDGGLLLNQADLGKSFGQWFPLNFSTNAAPAITGVGKSVYFFAKSVDGKIFLNHAASGQGGVGWLEVQGNGSTDNSPAACAVGNNYIFVAVKNKGNNTILVNQAGAGGPFGDWFPSN